MRILAILQDYRALARSALLVLLFNAPFSIPAAGQESPPAVVSEAPGGLAAPPGDLPPQLHSAETLPSPVQAGSAIEASNPHGTVADLTPMGMYRAAHPIVKAVMVLLALATLASWTIFLFKSVEIGLARHGARRSCRVLCGAVNLDQAASALDKYRDAAAVMAQSALHEMVVSAPMLDRAGPDGLKERVRSLLQRADAAAASRLRRGIGVLATIGAIAPFVGLFGTVWGIMNAFVGIAESKTSNLAIVAPGIAEALLATAIGLVAAIPAVVIYNIFNRRIAAYRLILSDAAAAVERLVSRDLDFRRASAGQEA